jgi:hypothetical protein
MRISALPGHQAASVLTRKVPVATMAT